jgi:hypothetical protein
VKTCIVTRKTDEGYRVGILHRADGDLIGGVIVAWLSKPGKFFMPTTPAGAKQIKHFSDAYEANDAAEKWFSLLRFTAEKESA